MIALISACSAETAIDPIYEAYPQIGVDNIQSSNYEIIKVAEGTTINPTLGVYFMSDSNNFIINNSVYEFTMLDSNGNPLDVYHSSNAHPHNSGVFFYQDYYVDWLLTGDKTKKKYSNYINADSLSEEQFEIYFNAADAAAYKTMWHHEPKNDYARNLLRINGSWMVLENEILQYDDRQEYAEKLIHHLNFYDDNPSFVETKNKTTFSQLDSITPNYHWKEIPSNLYINEETKQLEQKKRDAANPIYIKAYQRRDRNNRRYGVGDTRKGWNATGYFHIIVGGNELIKFKAYTYRFDERGRFDPHIYVYPHPSNPDVSLIAVEMFREGEGDRDPRELGIYVLRKKKI